MNRIFALAIVALCSGPAMAQESGYIEDRLGSWFYQPPPMPAAPPTSTEEVFGPLPPAPTTTTCINLAGVLSCTTR